MTTRILAAALAALLGISAASQGSVGVYFGTYTGGISEGIYYSTVNTTTGEISEPVLAAKVSNPSFLAIRPIAGYIYAVSESGRQGVVTAFAIDKATGKLKKINQQPSGGSGPCHVSVDMSGHDVMVSNYNSGSVSVIPINAKGGLDKPTCTIQHTGSSANPNRQKGPHAHSANISLDNRFVLVADLGIDKIMVYKLNPEKGTMTPNDPPFIQMAPGDGPRHLVFSPDCRFFYVINELSSTIKAFAYDLKTGSAKEIQAVSTLPADFKGNNTCAEVQVAPSGRFLYGSNRGHNSIVVYRIDYRTGKLTYVEHQTAGIKTPRCFSIDPSGSICLVANQDSDSVVSFKVDKRTGKLEPTGHKVKVGKPVCVQFMESNDMDLSGLK